MIYSGTNDITAAAARVNDVLSSRETSGAAIARPGQARMRVDES